MLIGHFQTLFNVRILIGYIYKYSIISMNSVFIFNIMNCTLIFSYTCIKNVSNNLDKFMYEKSKIINHVCDYVILIQVYFIKLVILLINWVAIMF